MAVGLGLVSLLNNGCGSYFKTDHGVAGFWCFGVCGSAIARAEWISEQKGPEGAEEKAKEVTKRLGITNNSAGDCDGADELGGTNDVDGSRSPPPDNPER